MCSKANLLTPGYSAGKYSIYCRVPSKENRQLMLKRPNSLMAFRQGDISGSIRAEGQWSAHGHSSLVCDEVIGWCFGNLNHQPSGSNQSGVYVLCCGQNVVNILHWVGILASAKQLKGICQIVMYISEGELGISLWLCLITELFKLSLLFLLNYFSFVSAFLHFSN